MTTRTISIKEYKQLITQDGWEKKAELRDTLSQPAPVHSVLGEEMVLTKHLGWATAVSALDGITITYKEKYSYVGFDEMSLQISTTGNFDVWTIEGVIVVDEAGARVPDRKLGALLGDWFRFVEYYQLGLSVIENVDPEFEPIDRCSMLFNNRQSVRFTGNLIAGTTSSPDRKDPNFSGVPGKWYENELYITRGGRYVCAQTWRSLNPDTEDIYLGAVCDSIEGVKGFFGNHTLSRKLYMQVSTSMVEAMVGAIHKLEIKVTNQPG